MRKRKAVDEAEPKGYPEIERTKDGLATALQALGFGLRYDERSKMAEWRKGGEWTPLTKRSSAWVREEVRKHFSVRSGKSFAPAEFGRDRWDVAVNALLEERPVDAFLERLKTVEKWDGNSRLGNILSMLWGCEEDEKTAWASRYPFLGAVQRAMEPGCKLREVPVLVGAQECGKSGMLETIIWPQKQKTWFVSGLDLAGDEMDLVQSVIGAVIVEAAEMVGAGRAELSRIKAFISRQDDGHVRLKFRPDREPSPRRAVIVGTANPSAAGVLPNDPSGNTRFVPIDLPEKIALVGPVEPWIAERRDQLWAEAVFRYEDGERANLPRRLKEEAAQSAETHRRKDDILEDAIQDLTPFPGTLASIAALVGLARDAEAATQLSRRDQMRLGAALSNAGWTKKRERADSHRVWKWHPPEGGSE